MHHVLLIPGFFGFSNLGDVTYFRAVRETIERNFAARGQKVVVHSVKTYPTGSLKLRAGRVVHTLIESKAIDDADHLHLVGHSTGGIDARIVASTLRGIDPHGVRPKIREKLRTVVCIASPHYGTPLANFFATLYGKQLLYLMTLLVFVGLWRRPVSAAASLLGLGYRVTDLLGLRESMLRQLTNQLLSDFTKEREAEVRGYLESVLRDVSLMTQLTPEAMEMLTAAIEPWDSVREVSYATVSPAPLKAIQRAGIRELLTPVGTVLYSTLYSITASPERGYRYNTDFPHDQIKSLISHKPLTFPIDATSNDGIVPTMSQIHGEFRGIVGADHLDVVGHYLRASHEREDFADWFVSNARFDRERFDALWGDVTEAMLGR